jgi:RNA polymerase sigma-70 factor (ECF subfamily)
LVAIDKEPGMSKQPQSQRSINHDESSLIAAILRGDRGLFHDLIRPYESSVYIMAFYLLRDEADAEDAALKAFLNAFYDLSTFHVESSFSTWLMSIVLNQVRIQLRKKKVCRRIQSIQREKEKPA